MCDAECSINVPCTNTGDISGSKCRGDVDARVGNGNTCRGDESATVGSESKCRGDDGARIGSGNTCRGDEGARVGSESKCRGDDGAQIGRTHRGEAAGGESKYRGDEGARVGSRNTCRGDEGAQIGEAAGGDTSGRRSTSSSGSKTRETIPNRGSARVARALGDRDGQCEPLSKLVAINSGAMLKLVEWREPGDWFPEGKPYRRPVSGTGHGGKSARV